MTRALRGPPIGRAAPTTLTATPPTIRSLPGGRAGSSSVGIETSDFGPDLLRPLVAATASFDRNVRFGLARACIGSPLAKKRHPALRHARFDGFLAILARSHDTQLHDRLAPGSQFRAHLCAAPRPKGADSIVQRDPCSIWTQILHARPDAKLLPVRGLPPSSSAIPSIASRRGLPRSRRSCVSASCPVDRTACRTSFSLFHSASTRCGADRGCLRRA
jgi:hypothetical protein